MLVIVLGLGDYLGTRKTVLLQDAITEQLIIAIPAVPHAALLFIASDRGYFAEEGLEILVVPAAHGKEAIALVVQGKAELGMASEVVLLLAAAKGNALAIAASMFSSSNDLAIVARDDAGIAAPRDLMGKRVGATLGTAGEYFLWAFLIRHQVPPDSVTLVDMPPAEMASAFAAGTIDAVSTWQPHVSNAQFSLGKTGRRFTSHWPTRKPSTS